MDRGVLWRKLFTWGISPALLRAIIALHTDTWVRVKISTNSVVAKIVIDEGLKQGCV